MPEGPEVKTIVEALKLKLIGLYLTGYHITDTSKYSPKRYNPNNSHFPGKIPCSCFNGGEPNLPLKLVNIDCKGKHIFFIYHNTNLSVNDTNSYYILESTLGTEGKYSWEPCNNTQVIFYFTNMVEITVAGCIPGGNTTGFGVTESKKIIQPTDKGCNVFFADTLQYGNLNWWNLSEYAAKRNTIGPDLLSEDISLDLWMTVIRNNRIKNKQICDFLMDQKYFSGIGNYLKAEILYHARIKPDRPLSNLTDDEIKRIFYFSVQIIKESYNAGGLTVRSYWDPSGRRGEFKRVVYDCVTDPYGNPVIKSKFKDGRTTHWVPNLQL